MVFLSQSVVSCSYRRNLFWLVRCCVHAEARPRAGDPAEVHQGSEWLPAKPGRSQRSHEQVLPAGRQHSYRREKHSVKIAQILSTCCENTKSLLPPPYFFFFAPPPFSPSFLSWQCCDLGFHLSVERVMKCYLASRWRIQKTEETGLKQLETAVTTLDQSGDRDGLLQQHDAAFCLPFRFNYHPHEGDQVKNISFFMLLTPLGFQVVLQDSRINWFIYAHTFKEQRPTYSMNLYELFHCIPRFN